MGELLNKAIKASAVKTSAKIARDDKILQKHINKINKLILKRAKKGYTHVDICIENNTKKSILYNTLFDHCYCISLSTLKNSGRFYVIDYFIKYYTNEDFNTAEKAGIINISWKM